MPKSVRKRTKGGPSFPPRDQSPGDEASLRAWIRAYLGLTIAAKPACPGHDAPWAYFAKTYLERPPLALVIGPRGGGKSFLSALDTHLTSRFNPRHGTRIVGGSLAQSEQVYRGLREIVQGCRGDQGSDEESVERLLKGEARYKNGSDVSILAASSTSVRGPHVASLKLDEVDEIDPEIRESAMGMCMGKNGIAASVLMTSTWHRPHGPMAGLVERARSGDFPLYTFCTFDVLEHCPEDRSGVYLEKCPQCPLVKYCHDTPDGIPKAKRANGHYPIDSLIQKVRSVGARTFEADYLCQGPRAEGLWFPGFNPEAHVSTLAEFDPALPVDLAIDSGVFTGAVFFQVATRVEPDGPAEEIRIFADYLAEGVPAESNARAILEVARVRCNGRIDLASTDPAGGSRNPVGPTVIAEYERVGLQPLRRWPIGSVADGLALVESFIQPADGRSRLRVHPRCEATIRALQNYRRARRGGQWQDYPEDPQHPFEELVDSLRGGLRVRYPGGRRPQPNYARVSARRVF